MAEKARLQALQVVEAPLAPEAHGVAAGARRRRGRAFRGPGQLLLGQLSCRARVSRLLVDRHGASLAHRCATPWRKLLSGKRLERQRRDADEAAVEEIGRAHV